MHRQQIVAGNWKMNLTLQEGARLIRQIVEGTTAETPQLILCPPFIHLAQAVEMSKERSNIAVGGQNCHQEVNGAYTGEISAEMLRSAGASYVILGHSERRAYFGEDASLLAAKVDRALEAGLRPIFCCGETLDVRKKGEQDVLVAQQVSRALFHLSADAFARVVIAYEPVWAIGTGETASPQQAQAMHRHIRQRLVAHYGTQIGESTSILYGGSVKPANAAELFGQPDVDGGLIGGASLKADDFLAIAGSFG